PTMRLGGTDDAAERAVDAPVRTVLEAHRKRQRRGELPMRLALRRPGADRRPAEDVREVSGEVTVEQLARDGQATFGDPDHDLAAERQALGNVAAAVEVRVADQPLPADAAARLLQVHAHRDQELSRVACGDGRE